MAATLTSIAITTRKSIRFGIYFILFLIAARITFGIGVMLYTALVPPKLPPPTIAFGPLPSIKFPAQEARTLTYALETASGGLPKAPEQLSVYYMPPQTANLFSADKATTRAAAFGFISQPTQLTQTLFEFLHPTQPKTMEVNIITGDFSISYNLAADQSPLQSVPPNKETAPGIAGRLLGAAGALPEDLEDGTTEVEFLKVRDQKLISALALTDASLTRVNYFRKAFGPGEDEKKKYPSVTATPGQANVWVILSGSSDREKQLVSAEYHYFTVDEEQSATYPLKTTDQAYQELQAGAGYIARFNAAGGSSTKIREVSLAYYDPNVPSEFYQPVFVFKGDNDFVAYVPAVTAEYYGVE